MDSYFSIGGKDMVLRHSPILRNLDDFFDSKWVPFATAETGFPMDIIERDSEYEVKIAVPGVQRDDLSVTLEKGNLKINASSGVGSSEEKYLLKGLKGFEYKRIIPNIAEYNVKADKISSVYKDGILSIFLPKEEEEQPRSIEVQVE